LPEITYNYLIIMFTKAELLNKQEKYAFRKKPIKESCNELANRGLDPVGYNENFVNTQIIDNTIKDGKFLLNNLDGVIISPNDALVGWEKLNETLERISAEDFKTDSDQKILQELKQYLSAGAKQLRGFAAKTLNLTIGEITKQNPLKIPEDILKLKGQMQSIDYKFENTPTNRPYYIYKRKINEVWDGCRELSKNYNINNPEDYRQYYDLMRQTDCRIKNALNSLDLWKDGTTNPAESLKFWQEHTQKIYHQIDLNKHDKVTGLEILRVMKVLVDKYAVELKNAADNLPITDSVNHSTQLEVPQKLNELREKMMALLHDFGQLPVYLAYRQVGIYTLDESKIPKDEWFRLRDN